jgi:hypothetical protein
MTIDVSEVNATSPYLVFASERDGEFEFRSEAGIGYKVSFIRDNSILGGMSVCHFSLHSPGWTKNDKHIYDPKVRETVFQILKNFLARNQEAIVYICDDRDGLKQHRFRLFIKWFLGVGKIHEEEFVIRPIEYSAEGISVYGGMICRFDNPLRDKYLLELENYLRLFYEK